MTIPGPLSTAKYISLETFRKSGAAVRTPVWVVTVGGELYVRTDPRSGKAKRIHNNPKVRVAPCTLRGEVTGDWVDGSARFVPGGDSEQVLDLFQKRYGLQFRLIGSWRRLRGAPPFAVIAIATASPQT